MKSNRRTLLPLFDFAVVNLVLLLVREDELIVLYVFLFCVVKVNNEQHSWYGWMGVGCCREVVDDV